MKTEHAVSAIAAVQAASQQLHVPDPVKTALYTSFAAVIGWAVGAALSWIAKKLGVKDA